VPAIWQASRRFAVPVEVLQVIVPVKQHYHSSFRWLGISLTADPD
jgi:hypothetical protein